MIDRPGIPGLGSFTKMKTTPLLLFAALVSLGCSKGDGSSDVVEASTPSTEVVAFEGAIDPKLAGTWESSDHRSTLILKKDGSASLKSSVATPKGPENSDVPAKWKTGPGTLLIQKDGSEVIRYYMTSKANDEMALQRVKGSTIKIVYQRKS